MTNKNHSQDKSILETPNKKQNYPDKEPLDKRIRYGYNHKEVWGQNVIWEKDVKSSLSNLKKRLKDLSEYLSSMKDTNYMKNIIDTSFKEFIGSGLLEGENEET
jgi:hypothetical protein